MSLLPVKSFSQEEWTLVSKWWGQSVDSESIFFNNHAFQNGPSWSEGIRRQGIYYLQKPLSYEEMHLRNSEDNSTDVPHTSAKIDTDGDCSSTRGFPDVPIDSKSKKENQSEVPSFYISRCWYRFIRKRSKTNGRMGVSWPCHYLTPSSGISW